MGRGGKGIPNVRRVNPREQADTLASGLLKRTLLLSRLDMVSVQADSREQTLKWSWAGRTSVRSPPGMDGCGMEGWRRKWQREGGEEPPCRPDHSVGPQAEV